MQSETSKTTQSEQYKLIAFTVIIIRYWWLTKVLFWDQQLNFGESDPVDQSIVTGSEVSSSNPTMCSARPGTQLHNGGP